MEKEIKEIFKNAIKQVNFSEIEKEVKNSDEMKKLDSKIDYLKTVENVFNHRIKICGVK